MKNGKNYDNRRRNKNRRNNWGRVRRYFKQNNPNSRITNLTLRTQVLPRIIEMSVPVFITNGQYSFNKDQNETTYVLPTNVQTEFNKYNQLYALCRIRGLRLTVFKTGQPVFSVTPPTSFIYPILSINVGVTTAQYDVNDSDNAWRLCYVGAWMSKSKEYYFDNVLQLSQWMDSQQTPNMLEINIGSISANESWSGFNFTILAQVFTEWTQPL